MVQRWFSTCFGLTPDNADTLFSTAQIERWKSSGALVIFMVHFAHRFARNGILNQAFQRGFERLAGSNGWFAPVSDILDFVENQRGVHSLNKAQAVQLELRWARDMAVKVLGRHIR
jgi:hypothetical protein